MTKVIIKTKPENLPDITGRQAKNIYGQEFYFQGRIYSTVGLFLMTFNSIIYLDNPKVIYTLDVEINDFKPVKRLLIEVLEYSEWR